MKAVFALLGCALALEAALAQQSSAYNPEFDARERARIAAERQQATQRFEQEEADCYQRFAVNDCLREVRKRRRVALEELRRQEIILNDERRAAIAARQQQRLDERAAERAGPQAAAQREEALQEHEARQQRAQEKQAEQRGRRTEIDVQTSPPPRAPAASDNATDAARRQELQRTYEERQREAEQRRQQRRQREAEQGPRTGKPLPVPP